MPAVALGEEVKLGSVSIRVFGVRTEQTAYHYTSSNTSVSQEEAVGEYVLVDYVAENASDSPTARFIEVEPGDGSRNARRNLEHPWN
ncbi:hypothetical protein Rxycam_01360 [Rubrobacter xylanophilus DSM 9941]|uniref:hypothetical protein n=1 Tax=Rubrobacter xylanophilus TaxID=49319 RepID=UPI001C6404CD|nr:hypothetical protein [Rubrobacter xylanophilus]QYJ15536.1 hypothetical protein Rxycam_01360 [Rubrobacter xylanophilus DSM 9941]